LVAIGDASLGGQPLERHAMHILAPGVPMTLTVTTDARIMLLGGEAFATKRHVWWNFVSSDRERINQAKHDWKAGAFPKVPGDEAEWIPIPDVPLTRSE
jgi:redox-sensitive bicupin YhaK (pirin superfamily)